MRKNLKAEIIKSKFKDQATLAREIGKRDEWLSRIICGRKEPTEIEKKMIAGKLDIDPKNQDFWLNS